MPAPLLFELIGFGAGLLLGSFLNVCISRLPRGESIARPRSRCLACGHAVRWYDNVPVLSWVVLRGRCRDCGGKISWRYPAVELGVGLWFALAATRIVWSMPQYFPLANGIRRYYAYPPSFIGFNSATFLILGFLLIGLMVMDWQTQRLPDAFTLTGTAIGLFLVCVQAVFLGPGEGAVVLADRHIRLRSPGAGTYEGNVFLTGPEALIFGRLAAVAAAALLLLAVRWAYRALRKRDGLGLGDVKLLAMIAAFLGFGETLVALLVGVAAASVYALGLMAMRRATVATRLPLGSFLAAGGLFAALFGQQLVEWYVGLIH